MSDDVTNWTELREFAAVDLEQSYVVAWETERESLLIEVDLFLLPDHAFYEEPRPAEGACFRQAVIEFAYCSQLAVPGKDGGDELGEAVKTLEIGRVTGLRRIGDGHYEFTGEFGTVGITAERPLLRLTNRLH